MTALRQRSEEFPVGVTPAQAISFALSICGFPVGHMGGTVRFIIFALEKCGFQIVPINNVVQLHPEKQT